MFGFSKVLMGSECLERLDFLVIAVILLNIRVFGFCWTRKKWRNFDFCVLAVIVRNLGYSRL